MSADHGQQQANEAERYAMEHMTVYQCIAEVQRRLAKEGISKARTNTQGAGYKFRGIDDIYNALASILAEVGLVIVPSYETRELVERLSAADKALFYVTVKGTYRLISTHDGSEVTAGPFWGEAMDVSDKATNKAMSAAYKYLCLQLFCIPTEGDNDTDQSTHEVKARITPTAGVADNLSPEVVLAVSKLANRIIDGFIAKRPDLAFDAFKDAKVQLEGDAEAKIYLWTFLDSKMRSTLKTMEQTEAIKQVPLGSVA